MRDSREHKMRPLIIAIVLTFAVTMSGCAESGTDEDQLAEGTPVGLPLHVVEGDGGSVLVFVEVHINEQGPFTFAIDTGASRTVIAPDLVAELGLESVGETQEVTSATGETEARVVQVETWRIGDVTLPEGDAIALELPSGDGVGASSLLGSEQFQNMRGLLGSDILSEFGEVTFNFEQERLILRSTRAESAP